METCSIIQMTELVMLPILSCILGCAIMLVWDRLSIHRDIATRLVYCLLGGMVLLLPMVYIKDRLVAFPIELVVILALVGMIGGVVLCYHQLAKVKSEKRHHKRCRHINLKK